MKSFILSLTIVILTACNQAGVPEDVDKESIVNTDTDAINAAYWDGYNDAMGEVPEPVDADCPDVIPVDCPMVDDNVSDCSAQDSVVNGMIAEISRLRDEINELIQVPEPTACQSVSECEVCTECTESEECPVVDECPVVEECSTVTDNEYDALLTFKDWYYALDSAINPISPYEPGDCMTDLQCVESREAAVTVANTNASAAVMWRTKLIDLCSNVDNEIHDECKILK